jgi:hypothetical protein
MGHLGEREMALAAEPRRLTRKGGKAEAGEVEGARAALADEELAVVTAAHTNVHVLVPITIAAVCPSIVIVSPFPVLVCVLFVLVLVLFFVALASAAAVSNRVSREPAFKVCRARQRISAGSRKRDAVSRSLAGKRKPAVPAQQQCRGRS